MAKGFEQIDPLAFTRQDELMGGPRLETDPEGLIPTYDQKGVKRWRRKGRLAGGVRDRILMAQMKSGMAALWADGRTYEDIAVAISDHYDLEGDERISAHGIQYHIKQMLDYWRQKGLALMDERQAVVLARFDQIEALAVEGYFASMEGKKTTQKNKQIERARSKGREKQMYRAEKEKRATAKGKDKGQLFIDTGELLDVDSLIDVGEKIQSNVRYEENRAGDPKFLTIIKDINIQRAKILGLYNQKGEGDADREAAKLTDEQREARIATILSAAKERRAKTANMLAEPGPLGGFEPEESNGHHPVPDVEQPDEDELSWDFDEDEVSLPSEDDMEWD